MGFPPASQQCAAYIPRVPKEKIVRYAICLQKSMRLCCTHEFEEYQESTTTLPIFRRRRLTWRLTRWDVWEGPRWRSVDRCEKQPFVQVQLIKAEDGGQINSKFKLIARKQTNFLVRCSYIQKYHQRWREHCAIRYTLLTLLTLFWAKSLNVMEWVIPFRLLWLLEHLLC